MRQFPVDFANIGPWEGVGDVEFAVGGRPWDQKVVYWDEHGFDGRLVHTHTKLGPDNLVGLLFDVTYVDALNYERLWVDLFRKVLKGQIHRTKIREVRSPLADTLTAQILVSVDPARQPESTADYRNDILLMDAKAEEKNGWMVIKASALDSKYLDKIIKQKVSPYCTHDNNRGWLPMGIAYFEYPMGSEKLDNKVSNRSRCKYVVSLDRSAIYLSPTHYKGFSIRMGDGTIVRRRPFYKVKIGV